MKLKMDTSAMQVGDLILGVDYNGRFLSWGPADTVVGAPILDLANNEWLVPLALRKTGRWGRGHVFTVERPGAVLLTTSQPVDATFPVSGSRWDSKCGRCGKGTYVGAGTRPTEHDGSCAA